jgi:hypothetical protein
MTEEMESLIRSAGAPEEMMTEMWFIIFCHKFADKILTLAEQEYDNE